MKNKTILLVEDNPDDEALTQRAIRKNGLDCQVEVVRDGQQALDYLFAEGAYAGRDPGHQPHMVLLDLKLPRVGGLEVLQRMRADARTRRIPVVVLTTSTEQKDIVHSYDYGANSFIAKPVDFTQFSVYIGQIGQYWLSCNIPSP